MPMLVLLQVFHGVLHGDPHITSLLRSHKLYIIPVVNMDGFAFIDKNYLSYGRYFYKRKNQNTEYEEIEGMCDPVDQGVDLNRNYPWAFGQSEIGSSDDPCSETYRGPYPFSEPETRALRDFIALKASELAIIYNFHTFGNLFLHPFSSDSYNNNRLVT
jgi:murein tripeptide amidase MpaA